ncbi:hypothetical protein ES707_04992 [subsurface metagenome]
MINWLAVWAAMIFAIATLGICHFLENRDKK